MFQVPISFAAVMGVVRALTHSSGGKGYLERVKKSLNREKHLAQRRRGAEAAKKIKQLFSSNLSASASRREIIDFFTRS